VGGGVAGVAVGDDLGVRTTGGAEEDGGAGGGDVVAQGLAGAVGVEVDAESGAGQCQGCAGSGESGADE
jgi:hypothetical protein